MNSLSFKIIAFFITITSFTSVFSQFKAAEDITISEAYDGDLYLAGGDLDINAPVYGDLVAAGGTIYVNDSIQQDLLIAGGKLVIYAPIGDDVRCAGGDININKSIGGDLIVFAGDIDIDSDAVLGGNLVVFGGSVNMSGTVKKNVKLYAGNVELNGPVEGSLDAKSGEIEINNRVEGDARIAAEEIDLGPDAYIAKDLNYWTEDGEIELDADKIGGNIRYDEDLMPRDMELDAAGWFMGGLFFFLIGLSIIVSGLLVILLLKVLFGHHLSQSAEVLKEQLGGSIGYGFFYLIGVPVAISILFFIVVGIPIGIFILSVYGFSLLFGQAVFSLILVYYLNERREKPWGNAAIVLLAWLFLIIIRFIGFIPFVGWLISILAIAAGYGAIILSVIKNNRAKRLGVVEEGG